MGFFTENVDFTEIVNSILYPGESIELSAKLHLNTDFLVVSTSRLIFVDTDGVSSRREIISVPFNRITEIAIEQLGKMTSAEFLSIQTSTARRKFRFYDKGKAVDFYKAIAQKLA